MYFKEIWVNSRAVKAGQLQRVFTEDPNRNMLVGDEGHDRYVSEAHLATLRTELKIVKLAFEEVQKDLAGAFGEPVLGPFNEIQKR